MVTREDLAVQFSTLALDLFPVGLDAQDLSLEDLEGARIRVKAILDRAEEQIVRDAQLTAEDVADDIRCQEREEVGRD